MVSRRSFAKRTLGLVFGFSWLDLLLGSKRSLAFDSAINEFDYIVIGSGAGGGPLACRLARAGKSVLLLEAGKNSGSSKEYDIPAFHPLATEDPAMAWDFYVKHYSDPKRQVEDSKHVEGKGIWYPRAGTLGGCTAHNAMITIYPHNSDWDYIADLTGDWTWNSGAMRKYFERLENCGYINSTSKEARGHGFKGWLSVNLANPTLILGDLDLVSILYAAASAVSGKIQGGISRLRSKIKTLVGVLLNRDVNVWSKERDSLEGLFGIPLATKNGRRNGTREFILETISKGHPLTLRTNCFVSRINFKNAPGAEGKREAEGVTYLEGESLYEAHRSTRQTPKGDVTVTVKPGGEVIVCAGVFNTPQILKLSGIGPKEELESFGIPVKVALPGVGKNLQDRYEVGVISKLHRDFDLLSKCTFAKTPNDPCLEQWKNAEGVYTSNGGLAAIVKKSSQAVKDPDLIIFALPSFFKGYKPGYSKWIVDNKKYLTWAILKAHTRNIAGEVRLKSTNPLDTPDINFKYFDEGTNANGEAAADLRAMVEGVKFVRYINALSQHYIEGRSIADTSRWERLLEDYWHNNETSLYGEVVPGARVQTDQEIAQWVKREAWGHHASCTAKIGADSDPEAVLDSEFKVRGTSNLRVVDASIFPKIPGFFIVSAIYMASEKAADVILANARRG